MLISDTWLKLILLGLLPVPAPAALAPPASSPNVVLIISDDQWWGDFGFMGSEDVRTPHLDALAAESRVFPRGYVPTALCRASLATLIDREAAPKSGFGTGLAEASAPEKPRGRGSRRRRKSEGDAPDSGAKRRAERPKKDAGSENAAPKPAPESGGGFGAGL